MPMSDAIANFEILVRHGALRGRFEIDDFLDAYRAIRARACREPWRWKASIPPTG